MAGGWPVAPPRLRPRGGGSGAGGHPTDGNARAVWGMAMANVNGLATNERGAITRAEKIEAGSITGGPGLGAG